MKSIFLSIFKIFAVIKDIRNYIFLRSIISTEKVNSPIWSKNNLRVDWLGRIYTVINLPPEVTMAPDLPKELYPAYLIDQTKDLNAYLTSLNLHEIIIPEFKEIPDSTSYLLVYYPYFRALGWWWIISRIVFWVAVFVTDHKTHIFSTLISKVISYI